MKRIIYPAIIFIAASLILINTSTAQSIGQGIQKKEYAALKETKHPNKIESLGIKKFSFESPEKVMTASPIYKERVTLTALTFEKREKINEEAAIPKSKLQLFDIPLEIKSGLNGKRTSGNVLDKVK